MNDVHVIAYYADDPTRSYQLIQWLEVLETLHAHHPVGIVVRNADVATLLGERTHLTVFTATSFPELTELYDTLDAKVALYCNNSMLNFQSLIDGRMLHAHINHGESDKQSMASNNAKAYDRVFVAGEAAVQRHIEGLLEFDTRLDLPRPNGVWDLGSAEAAEMAKLAETTYRDVNIGLANQFARFADTVGIDVHKVIEACNSQPYSHIHTPGIAVGGHCIPVYPRLYLSTDADATVVRTAREANAAMPEYAVARAESLLGSLDGLRVVVLGASYRGKVKETAFSGVFATVEALRTRGAQVLVHDPMYTDAELTAFGWTPYQWAPGRTGEPVDVAIVQADHPEYTQLSATDLPGLRLLLDGRRTTDPARFTGVPRLTIGGGEPVPA